MDKETLKLYEASRKFKKNASEISFFAATSMSNFSSAHKAGGAVLQLLNEDGAFKDFVEALYRFEQQHLTDYQI